MKQLVFLLLAILFFIAGNSYAQIKTSIQWTKEEQQWLETARAIRKKVKKYKRDSLVFAKRLAREYGTDKSLQYHQALLSISDSLREVYGIDEMESGVRELEGKELHLADLKEPVMQVAENTSEYNQVKEKVGEFGVLKNQVRSIGSFNLDSLKNSGKSWLEKLPELAESEVASRISEVGELQKQAGKFEKIKLVTSPSSIVNKGKSEGVDFAMQHSSVVNESVSKLKEVKKKYTYVPNSDDLTTARKVNSLENEPFLKRMKWGGTLQVQRGNINSIDFSPTIAYRINKLFSLGLGATYRASFGFATPPFNNYYYTNDAAGWRVYSEHIIKKPYFAHLEIEQLTHNLNEGFKTANTSVMLGLGREFQLHKKIKAVIQVLYNLSYDKISDAEFYKSPWNFRFGLIR